MNTFEFVRFVLLIGIFSLSHFRFHSCAQVPNTNEATETARKTVRLNKCDKNRAGVVRDFLQLPYHLQLMKSNKTRPTFSAAFGTNFYNFSLVYDYDSEWSTKNGCEKVTLEIPLIVSSRGKNETKRNFIPLFSPFGFLRDKMNLFIHPKNYCVKKLNHTVLTVEICAGASNSNSNSAAGESISVSPPLIQKCCRMGLVSTIYDKTRIADCKPEVNPPWKPVLKGENEELYPNYNVSGHLLPCQKSLLRILPYQMAPRIKSRKDSIIQFKDVRVLENGQVETRDTGNHKWKKLEQNSYCIDGYFNQLTTLDKVTEFEPFAGSPTDSFILFQCAPIKSESGKIKDNILMVFGFISALVLLNIVIVYGLIWKQQNFHGWTKATFSLAMFFWFFFTGLRLVYTKLGGFCTFIAVATHFFHLTTFSLMLLLNFDVWSTVSSMTAHSQRSKGHRRFLYYCCLAFGIPTLITSISLIIEHQFDLFDDRLLRPQYGRNRCYLDHSAVPAYEIYPTIILFLPNLIFVAFITKIVFGLIKRRKRLQGAKLKITTTEQNNNTEMFLCLKFFVIMGISWIFDIISGLTDSTEVSWYWVIPDIYNVLQPFLLFWIFVCTRLIRDQLADKYSVFKAGFQWMDTHLPRCCSAPTTSAGTETSESRETKLSAVMSPEENSIPLSAFNPTSDNH